MTQPENGSALAALEHFVVDNDELLQLEQRIGRFNIFDALGIVRKEIRHSNFLAWLLDPNESHGQGPLFLRAILMDLLKTARENGYDAPISPIDLDGAELRSVEVRREYRHIDILIECNEPSFVIAIENKVDSGEHSQQLGRYKKTVRESFGNAPSQFVYLTREGDAPSDDDWTPYTYHEIHNVLTRVRQTHEASIGDDVLTFLDHYLNLIGSRFMDDPQIDELCQTIYRNHRQAIELIVERVGSPRAQAVEIAAEVVRNDPKWQLLSKSSRVVRLRPVEWDGMLPQIGTTQAADQWAFLVIAFNPKRCRTFVRIGPTSSQELRRQVIERLAKDPKEFGLKPLFKSLDKLGVSWATLGSQRVFEWPEDDEIEPDVVSSAVQKALDKRHAKLAKIPDALRPIIEQWERERG